MLHVYIFVCISSLVRGYSLISSHHRTIVVDLVCCLMTPIFGIRDNTCMNSGPNGVLCVHLYFPIHLWEHFNILYSRTVGFLSLEAGLARRAYAFPSMDNEKKIKVLLAVILSYQVPKTEAFTTLSTTRSSLSLPSRRCS
jgi:hypothetical protein